MAETDKKASRPRPIVGTLGYILSEDRQSVLLVHRTFRKSDENLGKYNGVGGHLERGEDVMACMVREIKEETGLDVKEMTLRGTMAWANFGPNHDDWLGFIFVVTRYEGTPFAQNEEGTLTWHRIDELGTLPMWDGDRHFLPLVFDDDPRPFHGYMKYDGEPAVEWKFTR